MDMRWRLRRTWRFSSHLTSKNPKKIKIKKSEQSIFQNLWNARHRRKIQREMYDFGEFSSGSANNKPQKKSAFMAMINLFADKRQVFVITTNILQLFFRNEMYKSWLTMRQQISSQRTRRCPILVGTTTFNSTPSSNGWTSRLLITALSTHSILDRLTKENQFVGWRFRRSLETLESLLKRGFMQESGYRLLSQRMSLTTWFVQKVRCEFCVIITL